MHVSAVREEVRDLLALGPLPAETDPDIALLKKYERLYRAIQRPLSDDEARALIRLFGPEAGFGVATSLMGMIETAPGWPLSDCLQDEGNRWVAELRQRARRRGGLAETAEKT